MRKLQLKIFIIFCCCGLVHFLPQKNVNIHIYADPATTPALLQMRDFIKQPDKDYKIANWDRYYRHIHQSKFKNSFFTQTQKTAFDEQSTFFLTLKKLIETNKEKNVHLHLHFNLWHPNVYQFLTTHPLTKNKIKSIHAYEDSSGRFWWDQDNLNIFATSPIKPTFYYWGNEKKLCSGKTPHSKCHNFHQMHEKTNLVRIDFQKIAKTLSETDKQTLFDLAGFDYQKNKKLLDGKKTHFYILGYDWKIPIIGAQLSGLKKICNSPDKEERKKERKNRESWFYKNHPDGLYRPSHQVLNHLCPNIQSIDAHIPFELLLIAGFEPAKVSGYSSSLFFNQSHTQIGIYIPRINDPYVSILEIEKDLKEEQILTFEKQKKELQESQVFELVYDPEKNQSHWYLKTDNKTLLNIFTNKKLKIIEETENKIVIETNENGKKIQTYIQKDFYRYILLNTEKKP